jgi:uncharacterized membrane protein YphA (DoxX/SURF4 family)
MEIVFLVGRILFALVFVGFGIAHFTQSEAMKGYARAMGAPAPELTVPLTGVVLVAGGSMVALGIFADAAVLALGAFLVLAAVIFHAYWKVDDAGEKQSQQAQFNKNVALAGAALIVFYTFNQMQGGAELTLTDPLFGRG